MPDSNQSNNSQSNNNPPADVEVKIKSITVQTGITACLDGKPVKLPNWKQGKDLDDNGEGSKRPGVFASGGTEPGNLELVVKVKGAATGNKITLTGKLGDMVYTAAVEINPNETAESTQTVIAVPRSYPEGFERLYGHMEWTMENGSGNGDASSETVPIEKTLLELYWIYGPPGKMYKKGVWVEVLRLVNSISPGLKTRFKIMQRIINYCHASTSLEYDSASGASHYGVGCFGGAFQLEKYLEKVYPLCNCYDQAAAVQTFLGALGIDATWIYMKPFGYLKHAGLIGRGLGNNPFYLHEPPGPGNIGENNPNRTGFGSHSFCLIKEDDTHRDGFILDSCQGPHLGVDQPQQYLDESIDRKTELYGSVSYLPRPGTVNDMIQCGGVVNVEGVTTMQDDTGNCIPKCNQEPKTMAFRSNTGIEDLGKNMRLGGGVVFDWQTLIKCPALKKESWQLDYQTIRPGRGHAEGEWCFSRKLAGKTRHMRIEVFVSNKDIDESKNHLLVRAMSNNMPETPYSKNSSRGAPGHLSVVSGTPGFNASIWVFHNVCVLIETRESSVDIEPINQWIHEQVKNHVQDDLSGHLPVIDSVTASAGQIKTGEEVSIDIKIPKGGNKKQLKIEFHMDGDYLRLIRQKKNSLTFKGKQPGKAVVSVVVTDTRTLLCSHQYNVEIEVV